MLDLKEQKLKLIDYLENKSLLNCNYSGLKNQQVRRFWYIFLAKKHTKRQFFFHFFALKYAKMC